MTTLTDIANKIAALSWQLQDFTPPSVDLSELENGLTNLDVALGAIKDRIEDGNGDDGKIDLVRHAVEAVGTRVEEDGDLTRKAIGALGEKLDGVRLDNVLIVSLLTRIADSLVPQRTPISIPSVFGPDFTIDEANIKAATFTVVPVEMAPAKKHPAKRGKKP